MKNKQYTGFKDKRGNKIYVGDTIWLTDFEDLENPKHKITVKVRAEFGCEFEGEFIPMNEFVTKDIKKLKI